MNHFTNSQQTDYTTDDGNSYADREKNSKSYVFKEKARTHSCPDVPLADSNTKHGRP
jgi:hypothetical protein